MSSLSAVAENQSSHSQPRPSWIGESMEILERQLVPQYGEQQRARLNRGLRQIAEFWREEDGDSGMFKDFVCANFAADQHTLDTMFNRYQGLLEQLQGHMHEINREFRQQQDLDLGPGR